jgi:hypothetical protein
MKMHRKDLSRGATASFVGGVAGLLGYLVVGLLPSLVYGGYAGVALGTALLGAPLDSSILARAIVAFGMVAGVLATAGLFVVLGAVMGAGVHVLLRNVLPAAENSGNANGDPQEQESGANSSS